MFFRFLCSLVVMWLFSGSDESCPELSSVDNSIFIAKEVKEQILGTYVCLKGYHLVGEETLFCNASKEWNAPIPKCCLGHCPDPVLVNGESSSLGPVNETDKVTFKCNEHYILKGSNWSQCLEDHTWDPPLPICKSKNCSPPANPAHGYFEGRDFNSGSTITYHCEERYHLVGMPDQQCIDGEWNGTLPICEPIQEAPRIECAKAFCVFRERKEFCTAIKDFMQILKENGSTMEELKYCLEEKKAELEVKTRRLPL